MNLLHAFMPLAAVGPWALIFCALHVTLFALAGIAIYLLLARRGPAAAAWTASTVLAGIVLVTLLSLAPRPAFWQVELPSAAHAARVLRFGNEPKPATASADATGANATVESATLGEERPALLGEMANSQSDAKQPPTAAAGWSVSDWPWSTIGTVFLSAGIVWMTLRLAFGLWSIRRCRRRAMRIDDRQLNELADEIAGALRLMRPFELAASAEMGSPATVGWKEPVVILPVDWQCWSPEERRAVLAHELAHIYRGDYRTWVAALLVRSLHFYHPLVHWLVGRLRLQQEMAADALAMPLAGGRHAYLMTLARMTLDYDRRLAGPAQAFLPSAGTLYRRIEMLSNENVEKSVRGSVPPRTRLATLLLLAVCALLVVLFREPVDAVRADTINQPGAIQASGNITDTFIDCMSPEVGLVAVLRPAELFSTPEAFRSLLSMSPLRVVASLPAAQVRQLNLASSPSATAAQKLAEIRLGTDQAVLVLNQPADWQGLFDANQAGATAKPEKAGGQSFEFKSFPDLLAYAPSSRLLYVADRSTGRIQELLEAGPNRTGAPWKEVILREIKNPLVMVVPGKTVQGIPAPGAIPQSGTAALDGLSGTISIDPVTSAVGALAAGLQFGVVTARPAPHKGLTITLDYQDAKAAEQALATGEQQLKMAAVVAEMAVQQLSKVDTNTPPGIQVPTELLKTRRMFETMRQFFAGHQAKQVGSQLVFTTDVEFAQLADVPQSVTASQNSAARQRSMNNLKQVMIGMHLYHDLNVGFPAAAITSKDGQPLLSWRVAILPLIEQEELYKQFHLDEPWDSEHNKKLLEKMPDIYRSPIATGGPKSTNTSVLAIVGPHATLAPTKLRKIQEITDGTSQTIAVVETKTDIPWTKPEDLPFDPEQRLPKIEGLHSGGSGAGFIAGFADGHVRFIAEDFSPELLKKMFTIDGREPIELP